MAAEIALGEAGWLVPGRFRWARAMAWLCALAIICIIAFNLAADASLWLSAVIRCTKQSRNEIGALSSSSFDGSARVEGALSKTFQGDH